MENKVIGDANRITREYFDSLLVEMRHMDAVLPNTQLELYGHTFSTPVMMAALSHIKGRNGDGMVEMAEAAKQLNMVNWAGMGDVAQLKAILATGAKTIRIIKPYAEESMVLERIEACEEGGALAVGMDLDHSFNGRGEFDNVLNFPMRPRTLAEIRAYVKRTKLPFVIKGVLSVTDALKCLDAGVQGIVVSHHHGILPYAVPPLMVLPEIVDAVGGKMPIFVDCMVERGMDVFKALALGATAVSAGRVIMPALQSEGPDGAARVIEGITTELKSAMARTASPNVRHIDRALIWKGDGTRLIDR